MASATLSYSYGDGAVWLDDLLETGHPANHDLCGAHADRTGVPLGWELRDRRRHSPESPPGLGLRPTG
jgi:hypothetical protein